MLLRGCVCADCSHHCCHSPLAADRPSWAPQSVAASQRSRSRSSTRGYTTTQTVGSCWEKGQSQGHTDNDNFPQYISLLRQTLNWIMWRHSTLIFLILQVRAGQYCGSWRLTGRWAASSSCFATMPACRLAGIGQGGEVSLGQLLSASGHLCVCWRYAGCSSKTQEGTNSCRGEYHSRWDILRRQINEADQYKTTHVIFLI